MSFNVHVNIESLTHLQAAVGYDRTRSAWNGWELTSTLAQAAVKIGIGVKPTFSGIKPSLSGNIPTPIFNVASIFTATWGDTVKHVRKRRGTPPSTLGHALSEM